MTEPRMKIRPIAVFDYTYSNTDSSDLNRRIRLTVTNTQGCDTSWAESIAVHPEVRAAFSVDTNQVCYPAASAFYKLFRTRGATTIIGISGRIQFNQHKSRAWF